MAKKPRYEITKLIRKSRTGGIYAAQDNTLDREISMRRFFSEDERKFKKGYEEKFLETAQELSKIEHPFIRKWYDAGIDEDGPFLIAQTAVGDLIYDRVSENGPMSEYDVYKMAQQMLEALQVAHQAGFVHGALTARSIRFTQKAAGSPRFQLIDLGLNELTKIILGDDAGDTQIADPSIMAPELFAVYKPTESSDLYTMGHLCYLCLAGGHPFAELEDDEIIVSHQSGSLPRLSRYVQISPQFEQWIHSLIRVLPSQRPESAVDALKSLSAFLVKPETVELKPIPPETSSLAAASAPKSPTPTPTSKLMSSGPVAAASSSILQMNHGTTPPRPTAVLVKHTSPNVAGPTLSQPAGMTTSSTLLTPHTGLITTNPHSPTPLKAAPSGPTGILSKVPGAVNQQHVQSLGLYNHKTSGAQQMNSIDQQIVDLRNSSQKKTNILIFLSLGMLILLLALVYMLVIK